MCSRVVPLVPAHGAPVAAVSVTERPPGGPMVCVRPPGWVTQGSDTLSDLLAWAGESERLGLDGVFVGDRMLAEARTPGGVVYGASMLDAVVVLAAMAARTTRIVVGPLVWVFPYRHPLQTAKTFASLDAMSGGRVVLGAGIGWNAREFSALGVPMGGRADRFEEAVPLLRRLWTGRPVTHNGPTWQLEDVQLSPVPVRPGGPPIWMASFSPGHPLDWPDGFPASTLCQLERVGRLADGWVPLVYSASAKRRLSPQDLGAAWRVVLESAARAGRSRADVDFVYSDWCYVLDGPGAEDRCRAALSRFFAGSWDDARRTYTIGTADELRAAVAAQSAQVDRVDAYVLTPLSDEVEQLELLAGVAEQLRANGRRGA